MVASRIRHLRAVHSGTRRWGGPAGWRKPGALPSCGEGPVFDDQARVALEVGLVVGDQCGLDANGVGRNEAVEGILSALWNGGTQDAVSAGGGFVEWQDRDLLQEQVKHTLVMGASRGEPLDARAQLRKGDDRHTGIADFE